MKIVYILTSRSVASGLSLNRLTMSLIWDTRFLCTAIQQSEQELPRNTELHGHQKWDYPGLATIHAPQPSQIVERRNKISMLDEDFGNWHSEIFSFFFPGKQASSCQANSLLRRQFAFNDKSKSIFWKKIWKILIICRLLNLLREW